MRVISERLFQNGMIQVLVKRLRLLSLINWCLGRLSITRRIAGSDLRYRLRFIDSLVLMNGLLRGGEYSAIASDARRISTIVDLGCNVGFFPLYLCFLRGDRNIRGLLVDANPAVADEAVANLRLNNLVNLHVRSGLAGGDQSEGKGDFFVTHNSMSSSANANQIGTMYGVRQILVPNIAVSREFDRLFGSTVAIDLLKIDIEGSELEFIKSSPGLLRRCDRVIVEYHLPRVTFVEVESHLRPLGFTLSSHSYTTGNPWGVAYFTNDSSGGVT
jgi:FkbM family methyltransferase